MIDKESISLDAVLCQLSKCLTISLNVWRSVGKRQSQCLVKLRVFRGHWCIIYALQLCIFSPNLSLSFVPGALPVQPRPHPCPYDAPWTPSRPPTRATPRAAQPPPAAAAVSRPPRSSSTSWTAIIPAAGQGSGRPRPEQPHHYPDQTGNRRYQSRGQAQG